MGVKGFQIQSKIQSATFNAKFEKANSLSAKNLQKAFSHIRTIKLFFYILKIQVKFQDKLLELINRVMEERIVAQDRE